MMEEDDDLDEAMTAYRQASDYYLGALNTNQANLSLLKAAELAAVIKQYDKGSELFLRVVNSYLHQNLLRLNLPDLFLRMGLCELAAAGPVRKVGKRHKLLKYYMQRWIKLDYAFEFSREYLFLRNIMAIIPKADIDAFADHVYHFDNVAGLDAWCLRMLGRVKQSIVNEIDRQAKAKAAEEARKKFEADVLAGLARADDDFDVPP